MPNIEFSPKQVEYIKNANHRWNFKIGATQCGKTHLDTTFTIYDRLRNVRDKSGLKVIMGVSKSTIERNVLDPMREFWGSNLVGEIKSDNTAIIFGQKVYCLGAEKVSQVSKLRGSKIAYVYGDECIDWNQEVFELLKSRLSLPYSCADLTGNPANPTHHIKTFVDNKTLDIYHQTWTLFDNPFLPRKYVEEICKEYEGTVYFDRYVLGKWKRAEGVIYRKFADRPNDFIIDTAPTRLAFIECGIDFGGNKSKTTFTATGFTPMFREVVVLETKRIMEQLNPEELDRQFVDFADTVYQKYRMAFDTNYDNAEPVLARGIANACMRNGCRTILRPALKIEINQRIRLVNRLLGSKRFYVMRHCTNLIEALQQAVWNTKSAVDERLDDGTSDIDTLDSFEYTIERYYGDLMDADLSRGN